MDFQKVLEIVNSQRKANATNLTIRKAFDLLERFPDSTPVLFTNGRHFSGDWGSYRGYYEDLYLEESDEDLGKDVVGELKSALNAALNRGVMHGYKGGEFPITADTLMWFAEYGHSGAAVLDVLELEGKVYVFVKEDRD